ncbi:ATP-binding protein [Streptomyces sp. NPDC050610]|uniref:ATP-binding protein n=1 Tax=Streptomyces sp. NPDC050610 TaxID=3157097 RepID=UPI003428A936
MGVNAACPADGLAVPHSYTLYCPPLRTSPRVARDFVTSVLRTLDLTAAVDAAALCTSELVTNTYLHTRGAGSVLWLAIELPTVRVTVYDDNPAEPTSHPAPDFDEHGRGLHLVGALADKWGVCQGAPMGLGGMWGKGVWFVLAAG